MRLFTCLLLALTLALPMAAQAGERVMVFAAASLQGALGEVARAFEQATGHDVTLVHAGSSALARQIQAGAPADIFVSANAAWMDALAGDGLLAPGTRFDLAGNRLVLIGAAGAPDTALKPGLARHLQGGRLAVALTDAVPAGLYARAALTRLGLWEELAPHLAETDNVRAALRLVALGEAPLGVVYATDARAEQAVRVLATFPADSHPPVTYPAARLKGRDSPAADAFLAWLKGPETRAILARHGFGVFE